MAEAVRKSGNLLSNFTSLLFGSVGAKGLAMVTVIILSRYLGVEGFGRYSLVFGFWALLNTLVDLGGGAVLGRDIARDPEHPRESIEAVFYVRLLGCVLFLGPAWWLAQYLGIEPTLTFLIFYGIFIGFEAFYDAYFSATMQLAVTARARILSSLTVLLLVGLTVYLRLDLFWVVLFTMSQHLIKLMLDYGLSGGFALRLHAPDKERIIAVLRDSWPLWAMGLGYIVLARVDTLMLVALLPETGDTELGLYSAAFRVSEMLALLSSAIAPAILPLLVEAAKQPETEPGRIRFLAGIGSRAVSFALIGASLLMFWLAPRIVSLLYGADYTGAIPCLRILVWSQVLVAINTFCYQILLVYNAHGRWPMIASSVLVIGVNIGLNLLMIPEMAAIGASVATVLAEAMGTIALVSLVARYTPVQLVGDLALVMLPALIAGFFMWLAGPVWGVLSVAVYAVVILNTRVLPWRKLRALARERLEGTVD